MQRVTTTLDTAKLANRIDDAVDDGDLTTVSSLIAPLASHEVADVLERLSRKDRAVVFRLLAKDEALTVFESLDAPLQGELIHDLQDEQVTGLFAELDPDDRVTLLDELPDKQREILILRVVVGMSAEETAEAVGSTAGAVRVAQHRALARLKAEIISTGHDHA